MFKLKMIFISLIIPILIVALLPFGLDRNQSLLLATVILTATWWATQAVPKNYASVILIIVFMITSNTPYDIIFRFPFSNMFFLIVFASLLGDGIIRSNLAGRISEKFLYIYGNSPYRLIILSFILGIILIFAIPQPFPRVIILSAIYLNFLRSYDIDSRTKEIILFSVYASSSVTSMLFINGDIVLNNAAIELANISFSWTDWAIHMAIPTIIISIITLISFVLCFRKDIININFLSVPSPKKSDLFSLNEKKATAIIVIVLLLWMTETLHGINAAFVSFIGVVAMLLTKLLIISDFKKINVSLLIFLTAAFSIGGVLNYSGVGRTVFSQLIQILPPEQGIIFYVLLILIVMIIHMVLGSSITAMAVALPGLMGLQEMGVSPVTLTLIVYTTANMHFILPFHHVTIMIGAGANHYSAATVAKYGVMITAITLLSILFIMIPWWKIIGTI